MKVVLVNTPYKELYGPDRPGIGNYFPLGLGSIAAVLREAGHDVSLVDPEAIGISENRLVKMVAEARPGMVGLSCLTPNYPAARRIARAIRASVDTTIVMGGPHVTAVGKRVLEENEAVDVAVVGEGEITVREICDRIEEGLSLDDVEGLVFRGGDGIHATPPRPLVEDLDTLPHPARDLVDMSAYYRPHMYWDVGLKSATMIATRGCPYKCLYCASKGTMGDRLRLHGPEYVVDEMESLSRDHGVRYVGFMDDTLILNHRWVRELCRLMRERKLEMAWHCVMRVDAASEDILRTMKDAGCRRVSFGIETGDPGLLDYSCKGTTLDQARKAVATAKGLGLTVINTYMFGFPGETWNTIRNTIDFALELNPHIAMFSILVPYPGTVLFDDFLQSQGSDTIDWSDFMFSSGIEAIPVGGLSADELKKALRTALFRFYGRPSQLARILSGMKGPGELLGYVRGGLGVLGKLVVSTRHR